MVILHCRDRVRGLRLGQYTDETYSLTPPSLRHDQDRIGINRTVEGKERRTTVGGTLSTLMELWWPDILRRGGTSLRDLLLYGELLSLSRSLSLRGLHILFSSGPFTFSLLF